MNCAVTLVADILCTKIGRFDGGSIKLPALLGRGDGTFSLCPELDVARRGLEKARDNLREALALFFESASPEEVKQRLGSRAV
jgi:hypothetical protein